MNKHLARQATNQARQYAKARAEGLIDRKRALRDAQEISDLIEAKELMGMTEDDRVSACIALWVGFGPGLTSRGELHQAACSKVDPSAAALIVINALRQPEAAGAGSGSTGRVDNNGYRRGFLQACR